MIDSLEEKSIKNELKNDRNNKAVANLLESRLLLILITKK